MQKKTIARKMAAAAGIPVYQAERAYDALWAALEEELSQAGEVKISGIGAFKRIRQSARVARNPMTGESFAVPERYRLVFRPTQKFKDRIGTIPPSED